MSSRPTIWSKRPPSCRILGPGRSSRAITMSNNLYIGVASLELHVPEASSLKDKRSHTRSLIERIRNRHQVLVIESQHQDLYQRAGVSICAMSTDPTDLEARLQRVSNTVDTTWSGNILSWNVEIIQV
jgi:uncharacterized protein YlxP (DUF503 family)